MNSELIKEFREKLEDRVFGIFMKSTDPAFVESAGYAGCDFVILDMEHGPVNLQEMQNNIRAAQIAGTMPVVRVKELSETAISQALDVGAAAVQVPQIKSAQDAEAAVQAAKFYPQGERGVCRFVRAAHYSSMESGEYFPNANQSLLIIQVEGQEAMDHIDEILEVKGYDIIFIGPYDLSQSLGVTGQTTHPRVMEQMRQIVEKAQSKGIAVGTFTDSAETMRIWAQAGVQYISYSVDVGIFTDALRTLQGSFAQLAACGAEKR